MQSASLNLLRLEAQADFIAEFTRRISTTVEASYEALSYVWGDPSMTQKFETPEGHLSLTKSLSSSLMRLRHNDRPRVVWADGICINQASEEGKIQQVMLMDQIYSKD
jgi:hypothetical protein